MSHQRRILTGNNERRTPRELRAWVQNLWEPQVDLAASALNTLCPEWLGAGSPWGEDALTCDWTRWRKGWLNPPYGRGQLVRFVSKVLDMQGVGVNVLMLVPSDHSTQWWQLAMTGLPLVMPLPARVRFEDEDGNPGVGAPFPSSLLLFLAPVPGIVDAPRFW